MNTIRNKRLKEWQIPPISNIQTSHHNDTTIRLHGSDDNARIYPLCFRITSRHAFIEMKRKPSKLDQCIKRRGLLAGQITLRKGIKNRVKKQGSSNVDLLGLGEIGEY